MKKVWINAVPWNKEIVTTALESGADCILVPSGYSSQVKSLGIIKTIADDGDLRLGVDVVQLEIKSKKDEEEALKVSKSKILIIRAEDWKIIPLENLIAQTEGLIAEVKNAEEARTALQILERGVDGILLNTTDLNEIKKTAQLVKSDSESLKLEVGKITKIKPLTMGDRVCVDTCTNMAPGQGMLVGNSSSAMFLVHSESIETPYVAPRPFRVNAGAVHAYILVGGGKTKYLSELEVGDEVLIVDYKGKVQTAAVGRSKIEKRPLMLVEAKVKKKKVSLVLQNAETIRLTSPDGQPISIVTLKNNSEVLVYLEEGGRHFGHKVKETITEK